MHLPWFLLSIGVLVFSVVTPQLNLLTGYTMVAEATSTASMLEQMYCGEMTCYDVLGLSPTASKVEIKKAYRKLSLIYHPDRQPTEEGKRKFQKLAKAIEVLGNDKNREAYDYYLRHPQSLMALYYGIRAHYPSQTSPGVAILLILIFGTLGQYINFKWKRSHLVSVVSQTPQFKRAIETEIEAKHGSKYKRYNDAEKEAIRAEISEALLDTVQLNGRIVGSKPPTLRVRDLFVTRCLLLPWTLLYSVIASLRWTLLYRILKKDYTLEDKRYLILRYTGLSDEEWENLTEEEKTEYLEKEPWSDNGSAEDKLAMRELRNRSSKRSKRRI